MKATSIIKSLIIILLLLISSLAFSASKMPGEYIGNVDVNKILREVEFRGDLKGGNYELYNVVSKSLEVDEVKFSIFDDKDSVLKWLEVGVKTFDSGYIISKIMTSKGLMKGKLKRVQIKYAKYYPFEIDLTKNKKINEDFTKEFLKSQKNSVLKGQTFVKETTVKISDKSYKVKVYRIKTKNKDIEYALLNDKDTKLLGIAYLKDKNGISLFLKELGSNSLSVFPKEVPLLDFITKISEMSKSFAQDKDKREKAIKREKDLEKEDDGGIDKDDPIRKLNKMLEKEGK